RRAQSLRATDTTKERYNGMASRRLWPFWTIACPGGSAIGCSPEVWSAERLIFARGREGSRSEEYLIEAHQGRSNTLPRVLRSSRYWCAAGASARGNVLSMRTRN